MLPKWFNLWNRENPTNVFWSSNSGWGIGWCSLFGNIDSCLGPALCNR